MRYLDERGFTLIESLLHCMIFVVVAFIFSILLVICYKMPTSEQVLEDVKWEVTCFDINRLMSDEVTMLNASSIQQLEVDLSPPKKSYTLGVTNNQLAKKTNGGFELIHWPVSSVQWRLQGNYLKFQADFGQGVMKERTFYVQMQK